MKFIGMIIVIALSDAAVRNQDFDGNATFVKADTNSVHPQSDSNISLLAFDIQRSFEKSQTFHTNSQQNDVTNYRIKRPLSLYTPPKIGYLGCKQFSSMPYSTSRPSDQQYLSMCVPHGFKDTTSDNQLSHSSVSLPLNIRELSFTHSPPQLFPSTRLRPLRSTFRTGRQLGGQTGGNVGITVYGGTAFPGPELERPVLDGEPVGPLGPPEPPVPRGYPSPSYPSSSGGYTTTRRPFPPFTTPGEIGVDVSSNVTTTREGPRTDTGTTVSTTESIQTDEDLNHPPHIHSLDVECSKTMMTINIEFNRAFDGIIYSKGYFTNPECIYVQQNSGSTQYSFTVNLDSCGTQFINDFEGAAGQAYLENVLVLQNEPGIQEVWDTVRRVRCLWEGNINKVLTVNLSVDMLNQEIVTFSGDTATARLDIQIGRGPFAPAADGLVKIGETMTLVISVEGDPGFDLQVRDCLARDEASLNMLQLTDERGCILKPKLFGAFQKTNDTGNTGASIIAYAFFQAFKFPDVMDLFIECNVELCKTNCEPCPEANQQIEPGRRRRSLTYVPLSSNSTNSVLLSDPVRIRQHFKVIMLDDISASSNHILDNMKETAVEEMTKAKKICMGNIGFYTTFFLILSTIFVATISAVLLYIKLQRIYRPKIVDS